MKQIAGIIVLALALVAFRAQGDKEGIINALKKGNATQFSNYFDNLLDLKLPEKEEIKNIGKTQASVTVKGFFDDNKISGFDLTSEREVSGTMYLTGKLSGSVRNYNITLMMKNRGDKLSIITLRIN